MASIISGTTPTIKYTFNVVNVSDITNAYLTIAKRVNSSIPYAKVIEKDLTSATIGSNYLQWTLTQTESLMLSGEAQVMINWLTTEGVRGASDISKVRIIENQIKRVI